MATIVSWRKCRGLGTSGVGWGGVGGGGEEVTDLGSFRSKVNRICWQTEMNRGRDGGGERRFKRGSRQWGNWRRSSLR